MKLYHLSSVLILIGILNCIASWTQADPTPPPPSTTLSQTAFCSAATKVTHYALKFMTKNHPLPDRLPTRRSSDSTVHLKENHLERQKIFSTLFKLASDITSLATNLTQESMSPLYKFIEELKMNLIQFQTLIKTSTTSVRLENHLYTQTLEVALEVSLLAALIARESCPPHTALGMGYFTSDLE